MLQKILILYSFLILWLILVAKVHIIFGFIKCVASIVFENVNYLCYLTLEELFNEYKPEYVNHKIYSQTTILYNSKVFTNTLNYVVKKEEKSNIDFTKVGRNDKCPCGSGKKFKHCCGK